MGSWCCVDPFCFSWSRRIYRSAVGRWRVGRYRTTLRYGRVSRSACSVPGCLAWVLVDSFVSVQCGAIAKSNVMRRGVILGQEREAVARLPSRSSIMGKCWKLRREWSTGARRAGKVQWEDFNSLSLGSSASHIRRSGWLAGWLCLWLFGSPVDRVGRC